jgi:hypothetical protein
MSDPIWPDLRGDFPIGWMVACPFCKYNRAFFWFFFAIAIRLLFARSDGAGLRHGETLQYCPILAVLRLGFLADLCLTLAALLQLGSPAQCTQRQNAHERFIELINETPFTEEVSENYQPGSERIQEANYKLDLELRRLKRSQ